jgi:hypothetical protein
MANNLRNADLPDSDKDKSKLEPEEAILNLPEVKDIPGQENIHAPDMKEMADTTISSDDEEGVGIFGENDGFTNERLATGEETDEDDLVINNEAQLDKEEYNEGLGDDDDITDGFDNDDSDVTEDEKKALEKTEDMDTQDNENLYAAELDDKDFDGDKLNENIDTSGDDLDVPGGEEDDANEEIGEEDEENNAYSLGDNE